MLQPREADLPALILVLIILPLVTYFLLGIWNDAAKRKARINVLAQIAAEEACRVQTMASVDVVPITSPIRAGFHECARCFAPATTRCSRCKSVRYCSGKCQIIHWRQQHKEECRDWQDNSFNVSAWSTSVEAASARSLQDSSRSPSSINCMDNSVHRNLPEELQDDPLLTSTDTCHDSEAGGKPPVKRVNNKLRSVKVRPDDNTARALDKNNSPGVDIRLYDISRNDDPLGHKSESGNFMSSEIHRNQDTNCQPYANNATSQSLKLKGEGNGIKQSVSESTLCDVDKHVIIERESDVYTTSVELHGAGLSFGNETLDVSNSTKGTTAYKKPPYTLGHDAALPQKLTENVSREYPFLKVEKHVQKENGSSKIAGVAENNVSTNFYGQYCKANPNIEGKMAGSRKISKILKRNLVALNNNNKKNKMCKMLFPYKDLVELFHWETSVISPRGLINCGNSCYANAVLQCLACTKPLMVYLLRKLHSKTCFAKDWCLMCELEQHVSMLREGRGPLSPSSILSNMRNIGCRMGGGNQEDAHEFLRLLVMSMQSTCLEGLGGEREVNPRLQETTLIQQLFGGRLRSKVKCLKCHIESERYESIMDLTLEIHGWVESLEDALTQFTAPEDLDGENMYRCGRCLTYVKARKQLSLHEVPNILTIVLKRFQTGKYGKINKCVTFPDMLDMIPFVTGTADNPPLYLLYAVVVHLDTLNASFSGHYVSYVKDLQGSWFRIDDSEVQAVTLSQVMSEGAYMLFYSRSFPRPPSGYDCEVPLQVPTFTKRGGPKSQKILKHGQTKPPGVLYDPGTEYAEHFDDQAAGYMSRPSDDNIIPAEEIFSDSLSTDFSDATSSDWSLFTSSDESSFTTESTRNSFSTVDFGDNASIDAISSIFGPFYPPEYPENSTISCTKFSPSMAETRFLKENTGYVMDSSISMQPVGGVHKGRNIERTYVSSTQPLMSAGNCSLYDRYRSNHKDGFVQASEFCNM